MFKKMCLGELKIPSVRAGHSTLGMPHAHLCEGGVVVRTFWGFTLRHAIGRARRAAPGVAQVQGRIA